MSFDATIMESTSGGTPRSFRNFRLALLWAVAALAGAAVFALRQYSVPGLAGGAFALFALQAAVANAAGVIVRHDYVSLPRPIAKPFPLLVAWRTRIPMLHLRDATALGQFMGFETVGLGTIDGAVPALFSNRAQKLEFFKAITVEKADVKIYRAF